MHALTIAAARQEQSRRHKPSSPYGLSALLTTRADPQSRASGRRPARIAACYFVLYVCSSGTTELTDAIFILLTPSRLSGPAGRQGQRENAKEILSAEGSVSANHA